MSAQNTYTSRHRDQDAAISAVVSAVGRSAHGHSRGGPMQIDAGRAFLAIRWAGGADIQQPSGPDLGNRARPEFGDWK
jgi:hypothetical protein